MQASGADALTPLVPALLGAALVTWLTVQVPVSATLEVDDAGGRLAVEELRTKLVMVMRIH